MANANLELARHVVHLARAAGAEQCDVLLSAFTESSVTVRLGEVEKLIEAGSRSLGLRVINGGRTAVSSTSDLSERSLEALAKDTVELARISEADEFAGLPEPELLSRATAHGLQLYDERIETMTTDEKVAAARACEAAALGFDPRITNSDGGMFVTRSGEVALANSFGFASSYPGTSAYIAVEVMAGDEGGKKRNAAWYSAERALHRLADPAEVGRIAARRAVDQLGAKKVGTKQAPVVMEPRMTMRLMGDLASCVSGSALYRGATFLAGRSGQVIASPLVTIVDDPCLPGRPGSRPWDGEGVTSARTPLLTSGVFEAFLFDVYTARRTGNRTTGSAARGVGSAPVPGASNLVFEAGAADPEAIVADVADGLYLTEMIGFGFNPTTGDFSRGAAGFWIENGRLAFPVTEVNISGTMEGMLGGIDAVGADLTWLGGSAAPTIRIREMTVSGL